MELRIGASIGVAHYPDQGKDSHALLRAADVAMYQAKKLSAGIMVYDSSFDEYSAERLAVAEKRQLSELGYEQPVAINLSAHNLIDRSCFSTLVQAITTLDLPAIQVELELTETALMHDQDNATALLNQFNEMGVNIAIDDFGTGYSSLSYLRQLPITALKIDRSFVTHMLKDKQDSTIVRSTIALAHNLSLDVIAEGVEDDETLAMLRAMGCDQAQGFGLCRPEPLDQLIVWLGENDLSDVVRRGS